MEEYLTPDCVPSKTKRMADVLEPLSHQMLELELLSNAEATSFERGTYQFTAELYNRIVEACTNLLDLPSEDQFPQSEFIKERMADSLEEYKSAFGCCQVGAEFELTYTVLYEVVSRFQPLVTDMMYMEDALEVDKLLKHIENCCLILNQFETAPKNDTLSHVFRVFLNDVSECMDGLLLRISQLQSRKQKVQLMLCVSQIRKCLPMLWKALTDDDEPENLSMTKTYMVERIDHCFKEITRILNDATPTHNEEIEGYGSQFVHKMDRILSMLNPDFHHGNLRQYSYMLRDMKLMTDEILSHAMLTVQMCKEIDHGPIRGACLRVLQAYKSLEEECKKMCPNSNVCLLYVNNMDQSLQALERAVNTAVLRITFEVFSDPYAPLRELMQKCSTPEMEMFDRKESDLDDLMKKYDLHMERMMMVGFFAMACTRKPKKMLEIQSALASLESLEQEIMPTLGAHYLESMIPRHLCHLKILTAHWQSEVKKLATLLDEIVDPAAFCMVVVEELSPLMARIKNNLHSWDKVELKDNVNYLVKKCMKFEQLVTAAANDTKPYSLALRVYELLKNLKEAYNECKSAARYVLAERVNNDSALGRDRIYKRCEITFAKVRKFKSVLVRLMGITQSKEDVVEEGEINKVREYDTMNTHLFQERPLEDVNGDLESFNRRSKQIKAERSILYTPGKVSNTQPLQWPTSNKTQRLHRLFCRDTVYNMDVSFPSLDNDECISNTVGNDVSQILVKLSSVVNSFTLLQSSTKTQKKRRKVDENENSHCSFEQLDDSILSQESAKPVASSSKSSSEATASTSTSSLSLSGHEDLRESDLRVKAIFVGSENSSPSKTETSAEKQTCESQSSFPSLSVDCKTVCHPAELSSQEIDTPQRIMDLSIVDRKIRDLKTKLMA